MFLVNERFEKKQPAQKMEAGPTIVCSAYMRRWFQFLLLDIRLRRMAFVSIAELQKALWLLSMKNDLNTLWEG